MKRLLIFAAGLLAGALLATAGSVVAQSETVQATFQRFALVINGADPVEIEPLTYRGTTYLPVRQTANLLGYDVTYKADGKTITLTKNENKDVSDVNKVLDPRPAETTMPEYIPLDELDSYGVDVERDGEYIKITYGETTLTFTYPKSSGNIQMISGGYAIKREGDVIYLNSESLQRLLNQ